MSKLLPSLVLKTLAICSLLGGFSLSLPTSFPSNWTSWDNVAEARSSGGRSGGGSFSRPTSSNNSSSSASSSSSSTSSSFQESETAAFSWPSFLMALGIVGFLIWLIFKTEQSQGHSTAQELDNETVTVSKLQVALLASARTIQAELSEISTQIDPSTSEGLLQLLQEATLALLRAPEYWTHVKTSSQTVKSLAEAQQLFNQLSIAERSKFSAETLVNVGGKVRQQKPVKPETDETAAYIVVTLLIGTANDQPLFSEIRTTTALKESLEKVAAMSPDYLMVFELLWSPQDSSDSLSAEELLTEYPEVIQL